MLLNSMERLHVPTHLLIILIDGHPIFRKEDLHLVFLFYVLLASLLFYGLDSILYHFKDLFQFLSVLLVLTHDVLGLDFNFVQAVVVGHVAPLQVVLDSLQPLYDFLEPVSPFRVVHLLLLLNHNDNPESLSRNILPVILARIFLDKPRNDIILIKSQFLKLPFSPVVLKIILLIFGFLLFSSTWIISWHPSYVRNER